MKLPKRANTWNFNSKLHLGPREPVAPVMRGVGSFG